MRTNHASNKNLVLPGHAGFSRRHFLRGLGVCLALPAFESLLPTRLLAAAVSPEGNLATTATGAPLRTAFVYFPNGAIPAAWWPATEGPDFPLSRTLQPLAANQKQIQVIGGLDHLNAMAGADGGGDHARANGTFLTGVRLKKSATDIHAGISIDQAIARQVGHLTRFPSLELTCDAGRNTGACDSGYSCAYQYNLSWSSPTTPLTPEANPRQVFERLFGAGAPGERVANAQRRRQEQRSILDFVMQDASAMERRLDSRDQDKLDQYLTGVRELEARIQKAEQFGDVKDPMVPTPAGIPADYAQHIQLMYDIMVLAFQTDSTRVATMLLAHDGSNRSFADIGIPEGHHDLSHHQNNRKKLKKSPRLTCFTCSSSGNSSINWRRPGRGRQFDPAQFDDRLWRRQCGRQPPHAYQPADPAGGCRRRHGDAGPVRETGRQTGDEPFLEHGRPYGLPKFGTVWGFDWKVGEYLTDC